MKFEYTKTMNWDNAFRGLRHPMESYARSDSQFGIGDNDAWLDECIDEVADSYCYDKDSIYLPSVDRNEIYDWLDENGSYLERGIDAGEYAYIGKNDLDLAQRMIKAGAPNDKFLRQIFVSVDITAPLYWFKEMDTYKVATTSNSTSTMHKLASTPITKECFEMGDFENVKVYDGEPYNEDTFMDAVWEELIEACETLRKRYNETKDIKYWKELIRILPEAWLQTRTWTGNYANLRGMYLWRKDHKLKEWHQFCDWVKTLPYVNELIIYPNN